MEMSFQPQHPDDLDEIDTSQNESSPGLSSALSYNWAEEEPALPKEVHDFLDQHQGTPEQSPNPNDAALRQPWRQGKRHTVKSYCPYANPPNVTTSFRRPKKEQEKSKKKDTKAKNRESAKRSREKKKMEKEELIKLKEKYLQQGRLLAEDNNYLEEQLKKLQSCIVHLASINLPQAANQVKAQNGCNIMPCSSENSDGGTFYSSSIQAQSRTYHVTEQNGVNDHAASSMRAADRGMRDEAYHYDDPHAAEDDNLPSLTNEDIISVFETYETGLQRQEQQAESGTLRQQEKKQIPIDVSGQLSDKHNAVSVGISSTTVSCKNDPFNREFGSCDFETFQNLSSYSNEGKSSNDPLNETIKAPALSSFCLHFNSRRSGDNAWAVDNHDDCTMAEAREMVSGM